ncbi:MAG: glycosyltransferase family 39 protein [Patescibacteria group bacterium]
MKRKLSLLFVTLVSFLVIFVRFNQIPKNLTFDEVEFAKLALSLDGKPFTPYSSLATGHSTLYFYILLFSFKLFGVGNFALRFPAALFGVFGSLIFYLVMDKVFKKNFWLVFGLSLTFATTRWYFNFARFSFEATFLLFLELASIYFLLRSRLNEGGALPGFWLALSGLFAGLAFNSYTPGRFFFVVPLVYILATSLKNKKQLARRTFMYAVPFLIAIAPLTVYLATHQDNRVDKLFFWKNHEMTVQEKVIGTMQNISSVGSMFVVKGDMSGKHNYPGKPALNPIIGLLFVSGLLISLRKIKSAENLMFAAYLFVSILPSLMIYPWENPNMLRTFTAIPSVIYFTGVSSLSVVKKIKRTRAAIALLAMFFLVSSLYEIRTYFVYQAKVFPSAFETKPTLPETLKHINFKYK